MLEVLLIIAPLFLIIFVSALVEKFKKVDESWSNVLNSFALNIGLPALIFSALSKASFSFSEQASLIIANSALVIGSFILAFIVGKIFRFKTKLFRTVFICLGFGNVAYLGIPTLVQVSGESILPTASLLVAIYVFWLFTLGLGYLNLSQTRRKRDVLFHIFKDLIKNHLLISVVLGILVASLNISIPKIIDQSIQMLAASVTPVVLVVIGLFIGKSELGKIKEWIPIFIFSAFTLLLLPLILYFGVQLFNFTPKDFSASIIDAAMPLAITPFALAKAYKLDKNFIARSIVLSTILSVITIPFWTSLL